MSVEVPYPGGGALLRSGLGVGAMYDAIGPASFDLDVMEDSFLGDALNARYPAAKTNGTSAAVTFTEHNVFGYIDLVTGTDNDGYAGQGFTQNWNGDRGFLAEFLFETPAVITTLKFEFGVSDADDDAGAVLDATATPITATAGDFAVFYVDTDDDANIHFASAKAGTVVNTQDIVALVASRVYYAAVRVKGDNVSAYLGDPAAASPDQVAGHGAGAGIEGATAVGPWGFAQARAVTASRTMKWLKWRMTAPSW